MLFNYEFQSAGWSVLFYLSEFLIRPTTAFETREEGEEAYVEMWVVKRSGTLIEDPPTRLGTPFN